MRKLIRALSGTDLRAQLVDGYIKPSIFTFSQKTGRNSPKPSRGFVLNLPPWLRTMIRPKRGMVFIGADWAQQEIAIAAGLSGDENLLTAYNNPDGDVYLTLAKMAGAVPPEGTKDSHRVERKTFKAIQLGLGYGKGVRSLALDVFQANCGSDGKPLLTLEGARLRAEEIYEWHQETFRTYWEWLRDSIDQARVDEYFRSVDGWTYFVSGRVRNTQLLNYPLQSAGAAMMRRATIRIAETRRLDLVCSLHDALYINCREDQREDHVALLLACMHGACRDILGARVRIPVSVNVYDAISGYRDPRADQIEDMLQGLLSGRQAKAQLRRPVDDD
jgi:DNA polymerase-1